MTTKISDFGIVKNEHIPLESMRTKWGTFDRTCKMWRIGSYAHTKHTAWGDGKVYAMSTDGRFLYSYGLIIGYTTPNGAKVAVSNPLVPRDLRIIPADPRRQREPLRKVKYSTSTQAHAYYACSWADYTVPALNPVTDVSYHAFPYNIDGTEQKPSLPTLSYKENILLFLL